MDLRVSTAQTPLGDFHMVITPDDIVHASGFGQLSQLLARLPSSMSSGSVSSAPADHPYALIVNRYFSGIAIDGLSAIPCQQEGGAFSQSVWQALCDLRPGEIASYKTVAERVGSPAAVRAVGTACASNMLVLLVPCHRVIRSDGEAGEYRYGTEKKQQLLHFESGFLPRVHS